MVAPMSGTDQGDAVSPEIALVDDANHQALVDPLLHSKVHIVSKLTRQWWHKRYGVITQHDEDVMLGAAVALYCETYGWPAQDGQPKLPRAVEAGMRIAQRDLEDKCPRCGSTRRELDAMIADGRAGGCPNEGCGLR